MNPFDAQLLRLKQGLGVAEDQQVAELLGMTKAGLSARKRRASFPREKVEALAIRRPDLHLDCAYITTGKTQRERAQEAAANAILPAMQKDVDRTLAMTRQRGTQTRPSATNQPTDPPSEKLLLASYRRCTVEDKKRVVDFAVRLAKP